MSTRWCKRNSGLDVQVGKNLVDALPNRGSYQDQRHRSPSFRTLFNVQNQIPMRSLPSSSRNGLPSAVLDLPELVGSTVERRYMGLWTPKGLRKLWHMATKRAGRINQGGIVDEDKAGPGGAVWKDGENDYPGKRSSVMTSLTRNIDPLQVGRIPDTRPPTARLRHAMHTSHDIH